MLPGIAFAVIAAGVLLTVLAGVLIEQLVRYISWKFRMETVGVAAIFAPVMTSFPELATYIVALAHGEVEIAWGSIVAQPFMASTIIYPLAVLASLVCWALKRRRTAVPRVDRIIAVPLLAFAAPLLPLPLTSEAASAHARLYGAALLALYFAYARFMLREKRGVEAARVALKLGNPVFQALTAILSLYLGCEILVSGIKALGETLKVDKLALSIVLVPIATALPESIVGLVFLARGRDSEGVSAIVGEKALYSTFYPGVAMLLGTYSIEPAAASALLIAIMVSAAEAAIVVLSRNFGLTAPVGLAGYVYYITCCLGSRHIVI
jgi:cation:H+ antiporter